MIEDGQAMMVIGGRGVGREKLNTTQIVRPNHPTEYGPQMNEGIFGHCSTTLLDGSVLLTGGTRGNPSGGSPRTDIYNFTTAQWTQVQNMRQRRTGHSCTQVWLDPDNPNILSGIVTNTSVLGVVVAGGIHSSTQACIYKAVYLTTGECYETWWTLQRTESVELYLPWNDTWIDLPTLPQWKEFDVKNDAEWNHDADVDGWEEEMTVTQIMSLANAGRRNILYLLGGANIRTYRKKMTNKVWWLAFNTGNHSYYWYYSAYHAMGKFVGGCPVLQILQQIIIIPLWGLILYNIM